ncbi:MAG: three-Cys-motif partner protein TcmP [Ferruginibacter sp.]
MGRNLFRKAFDDGTIDKLQIFEDYFKEWLPVFISRKEIIWHEIQIFDFFAGEGTDVNGVFGSPMRILEILNKNKILILNSKEKIKFVANEFDKEKFQLLEQNLNSIIDDSICTLEICNDDFINVFNKHFDSMKQTANFLFLDQNGIKQITEEVFGKLISLKQTDFLFFISSSYIKRFSEVEEFKKYLRITSQDLESKSYYHIHRVVLDYYRSKIPTEKKYFLAPFSIKKPSGIYGLIFGTNHTLGIEKFLHVCWRHDKLTGEANFDIDNEKIDINNPGFFAEYNIPTKKQIFNNSLKEKIINGQLKTDVDVYLFALNEGFLLKDANIILRDLNKTGKISFDFKLCSADIHKIRLSSGIKIK